MSFQVGMISQVGSGLVAPPGRPSIPALTATVLLAVAVALVGCGGPRTPDPAAGGPRLPTPLPSLTATLAATAGLLRGAVAEAGFRLDPTLTPVRPSEPQSLVMTPRAALRASLAEPDEGFVIIYDLADAAEAQARADDLAAYLESGFGQSNFTADTRFSVAVVDDTLVFTWWIPSHSSDRESGEAVFEAISRVGDPVEVTR
jgi:hypothetical protein